MKKLILLASLAAMPLMAMAQHEEDTENGVVSLAGREGFTTVSYTHLTLPTNSLV